MRRDTWAVLAGWMRASARPWLTQSAGPRRCSSAVRSGGGSCAAGPRDCSPRRWCPRAYRQRRRWRGARCGWSSAALWCDRQWGPGSRHVFRSAVYHLKPRFVVASRPPAAPGYCGWWPPTCLPPSTATGQTESRTSKRRRFASWSTASCIGVVTDQHEGERLAVAALTTAVAGGAGENAAYRGLNRAR